MSLSESGVGILMGTPLEVGIRILLGTLVAATWNLNTPLDRARRVALGTALEHLEHVVKRIRGNITQIWCWLHLRVEFVSISDHSSENLSSVKCCM